MSDIAAWLKELGLGQYADVFVREEIDFDALPHVTADILKDIGLPAGPRLKILAAVKGLQDARPESPAPPPRLAERRQITVMFCDLVGSTALSEQLDPEDLRDLMQAYQKACGAVIERYGGHVAQYLGDGLMTYFGWPQAHEDDAERAIRAGLDIVGAVKNVTAPAPLQVRVGVATGPVVVGETGSGDASVPKLAVGETPNLAARVQGLSDSDHVVIGPTTRRLVGGTFDLDDLGAHTLKGIVEPVQAWRVTGVAQTEGRFEARGGHLTPFVGRDAEIAMIMDRWQQAKAGEGQVVLLCGEPGIGKSRITQVLRERFADEPHTRLRYQCSPYYTNSALYPVIEQLERAAGFGRDDTAAQKLDKLETLLSLSADDVKTVAALFAPLLSIDSGARYSALNLSPQKQKELTLQALSDQVVGLAAAQPLLMIFEDAHWIDPTTQESLELIVPAIAGHRALVVVTYRPEYEPPWTGLGHITPLTLTRLGKANATAMVERVTGGRVLPDEVLDQIVAKTDGVPLFVEELTKTVIESGVVTAEEDRYVLAGTLTDITIPSTLQDSLMARLDRLSPVKETAQIGACIGREFSYELLAAVSPLRDNELQVALQQLINSELIFRSGTSPAVRYTFKHALVQDTAYGSLLRDNRRQLHVRIAEMLEKNIPDVLETKPELVAHHLTRASAIDRAVPLWLEAGNQSREQHAHLEALEHLKTGLNLVKQLPESVARDRTALEFHMAMASSHCATSGWASNDAKVAYDHAKEIIERLGGDDSQFDMLVGMFYFYNVGGFHDDAVPLIFEAVRVLESDPTDYRRTVGYQAYGQSHLWRGDFARSTEYFERSMSAYEANTDRGFLNQWGADFFSSDLCFLGIAYWALGYPDRARAASQKSYDHVRGLDRAHHLAWTEGTAPFGLLVQHRFEEAKSWSRHGRNLAQEIDFDFIYASATISEGCARIGLGEYEEGAALLVHGIDSWGDLGGRVQVPHARTFLALSLAKRARFDEALDQLSLGLGQAKDGGEHWTDAILLRARGEIFCSLGETDPAAEAYREAVAVAREQGATGFELPAATSLARLWQSQGKHQQAYDMLAPVYGWFTEGFDTKDLTDAKALLEELQGAL